MSQGTFQMRLWQKKLNKSMILPVLSLVLSCRS